MARKTFTVPRQTPSNAHIYAEFMAALLAGTVTAVKLIETVNGRGRITKLEYDEP